jgi:ribonuclease HI
MLTYRQHVETTALKCKKGLSVLKVMAAKGIEQRHLFLLYQSVVISVYTDGSVTKDQSGWGFTVKQGATTIHEDSAAYEVSTSSLTMETEAVTHALRWIASRGNSQTTHAIILTDSMSLLQKVKSGMGSPDWHVSMFDIHLRKILWVYCPGHAGVKGNDRADRLAGKATITGGLRLGRSEVVRSLRHYLRAQSQGHHTIDHLEERGIERGSAQRSSLGGRERAIVNQTNIGTVSRATLGKLLRDGVERIWAFPSA